MSDQARLDAAIDVHEGFRAFAYLDTRKLWTVGKGRCLETHPLSGAEWKYLLDHAFLTISVSMNGADWLRDEEVAAVETHLAAAFSWWSSLNDARQNALIEMAYQMGVTHFDGFHNMLAAIHVDNWPTAYQEALDSDYGRSADTGPRAKILATQLLTGQFA